MRRFFITLLLVLLLALGLIAFVEKADGYVLLALGGTTIEMPFLLAALLLLFTYMLLWVSIALLRGFFQAPGSVSRWVSDQRQKQSVSRTGHGLVAYIEGRWDYARKSLERSAPGSNTPFVNYLFAARASSELGDVRSVNGFLQKAEQVGEGADVAIGLTQAELQLQNRQYEQALATLLRIRRMSQNHPVGTRLLAEVYVALGDWHNLLKLLSTSSAELMPAEEQRQLENRACAELLAQAEKDAELAALQACWKRLPSQVRRREEVIAHYVHALLRQRFVAEAETVVRQQLQRNFSSEMAELYGMTEDEKPARQLAFVEKLLKSYSTDAALLLTAGRMQLRVEAGEQAEALFEKSLQQQPSAAAFAELASIHAQRGDYKQSSSLYAQAAILRGGAATVPLLQADTAKAPAAAGSSRSDQPGLNPDVKNDAAGQR